MDAEVIEEFWKSEEQKLDPVKALKSIMGNRFVKDVSQRFIF